MIKSSAVFIVYLSEAATKVRRDFMSSAIFSPVKLVDFWPVLEIKSYSYQKNQTISPVLETIRYKLHSDFCTLRYKGEGLS